MVRSRGNGFAPGHIIITTSTAEFDMIVSYRKKIIRKIKAAFDDAVGAQVK